VPVKDVSDHTGFPEILDGRVKTLVPQVHGGLLGRRDLPAHRAEMAAHAIAPIDLIAVNLYPFEATVAAGAGFEDCIENIDIGGPAMIRSAAKNHAHVVVLTEPGQFAEVQL
jgi:phosphoribosylaminoimidazolecarboxamide formyltransferase/IMP cyclohydrolase